MAGIVPIVEQGFAFNIRIDRQQYAFTFKRIDEDVATPIEETQVTQRFADQLPHLSLGTVTVQLDFHTIDRLGQLHRLTYLSTDVVSQHGLGLLAGKVDVIESRIDLLPQYFLTFLLQ